MKDLLILLALTALLFQGADTRERVGELTRFASAALRLAKARAQDCASRTAEKPPGVWARGKVQEVPSGVLAFQGVSPGERGGSVGSAEQPARPAS